MLIDEAECGLVEGAVVLVQVVIGANHGQEGLGPRAVWQAHLVRDEYFRKRNKNISV